MTGAPRPGGTVDRPSDSRAREFWFDTWSCHLSLRFFHSYCNKHAKVHASLFRADLGTDVIMQGKNVKGLPSGPLAQSAKCLQSKQEALGLSPSRATIILP